MRWSILIFPLGLKTVYIPVSSFSFIVLVFIVLSMLNVLAIYTQIVMSRGKHACLHLGKHLGKHAYLGLSLRA